MGLDMYLTGRKHLWKDFKNPDEERKEDGFPVKVVEVELGYWRKHPNLHGCIIQTFAEGDDSCQPIDLDAAALERLIQAVADKNLPHTEGFFFGRSDGSEREEDLAILNAALKWLTAVPEPPPLFVDEGQQSRETLGMAASAEAIGLTMKQVNIPKQLPKETRSVVYQASW